MPEVGGRFRLTVSGGEGRVEQTEDAADVQLTIADLGAVYMLRGREVDLSADRPLTLMADGEQVGQLPAHVSVAPHALAVVVGPQSVASSQQK